MTKEKVHAFAKPVILTMQLLYCYTFIRPLSFAFHVITMSTLESHFLATYLGNSSSTPCLQHSNCLVNQMQEAVYTYAFHRKCGCREPF